MTSSWKRWDTWLALAAVGVCLAASSGLGLWSYMSSTAAVLHPVPAGVPSVMRSTPGPRWTGAVERARLIVREALREQNVPGISVAVGVGDGPLVWAEGFGFATLDPPVPVAPETQFRIGTASMALTSAGVGVLVERGRLSLDDEIQTHVPAFPRASMPVTLRQLMGHVAGVRNDGGDEGPLLGAHCDRLLDALPHFAEQPLLFEPGTRFHSSSYGWVLVSAAVEAAAGAPFLRFMRKQVFDPLIMDDTAADSMTESLRDRATFYFPRFAADPRYGLHLMRPVDYSCYGGASAFLSTPSDLVRFAQAMRGDRLLTPETARALQTSQRLTSGDETRYGLGWAVETTSLAGTETRLVSHDGVVLGGTVATLAIYGDGGPIVAVTSNMSYTDTHVVATRLAQAFAEHASAASPP